MYTYKIKKRGTRVNNINLRIIFLFQFLARKIDEVTIKKTITIDDFAKKTIDNKLIIFNTKTDLGG